MYRRIADFPPAYKHLTDGTSRVLAALTDESLDQAVADGHRTIGRIAWHIVTAIPEMMNRTGLGLSAVDAHAPPPSTAAEIADGYARASKELLEAVTSRWTDEMLTEIDEMYGQKWPKGVTLSVVIGHETHHRGQLTVLMRQAGLTVPGTVGPAKQDWAKMGMEPPAT